MHPGNSHDWASIFAQKISGWPALYNFAHTCSPVCYLCVLLTTLADFATVSYLLNRNWSKSRNLTSFWVQKESDNFLMAGFH